MERAHRHQPGGIARLLDFLAEHGEAVEADLLRHYGVDLYDVGSPQLTWRRLAVLLRNMPLTDSATWRRVHGELVGWGPAEHLLATVVDVLQAANWQRSGGKSTKPLPLRRPGADEPKRIGSGAPVPIDELRRRRRARR